MKGAAFRSSPGNLAGWGGLFLLLLISAGGMVLRGQIPFTSDQAISLLMALDIRDNGSHPVFYWGVFYAGTLEAHVLSLLFRVVPPSVEVYRAALFVSLALVVFFVGDATRRMANERAGWIAGGVLALGPSYFFYKGLTSDGAYTSLVVVLALALWFLARITGSPSNAPLERLDVVGLGISLGLGWWIHPLSITAAPAVCLLIAANYKRPRLLQSALAGFAGFGLGSLPWWIKNLRSGFPSLHMPELGTADGAGAVRQVGLFFEKGWPILSGARSAWALPATFPGAELVAVGLLIVLVVTGALCLARSRVASQRLLGAVSLSFLFAPPALAFFNGRTDLSTDPRYLLPMYLGAAPLTGLFLSHLLSGRHRWMGVLAGGALLALGPGSQWTARRFDDYQTARLDETRALAEKLRQREIDGIYTPYWFAYRYDFIAGSQPPASSFGIGNESVIRSFRHLKLVDEARRPGFVLDPARAEALASFLRARSAPFRREPIPSLGLDLLSAVPASEMESIRRCRCIPSAIDPGDVVWAVVAGPDEVVSGSEVTYSVRITVVDRSVVGPGVNASYWWVDPNGVQSRVEGGRTSLSALDAETGTLEMDIRVRADVPPGTWRLVFDLVEEQVTWFADRGVQPASKPVRVVPAPR